MESVGVPRGQGKATIEAFAKHEVHREKVQHIRHVFFDTAAEKIVNFSGHNRYVTVPIEVRERYVSSLAHNLQTATLKDLIHNLKDKDLHRVAAVGADGKIVKIFSQSTVIAYLAKNINDLGQKAQQTIKAANIGTRPVQLVAANTRTIDAFVMMTEHAFSAVGFVASHGGGNGNLSVKDVQGLLGDNFGHVVLPVQEYVSHVRQDSVRDIVPLVQVSEDDNVAKAVQRIAAVGVHRIYVSGADGQPVAVVALGDLIPYFA